MYTFVILIIVALQTLQFLIHVSDCSSDIDLLDQDSVGSCDVKCEWRPLHISGGIFVNGQCKDSGWNQNAQRVLQDAEILQQKNTTMLDVFNALETQFSHCRKFILSASIKEPITKLIFTV